MDGVPSAEVGADVSGGVVDPETVEVGVGAASDEAAAEVRSPASSEIRQEKSGGMFRAAEERLSGIVDCIERRRIVEVLRGSVGVGGIEQETRAEFRAKGEFGTVGEGAVDVDVLADESCGIDCDVVDLVVEEIVEVGRGQLETIVEK